MLKSPKKVLAVVAGLAALGLGGSAIADAATSSTASTTTHTAPSSQARPAFPAHGSALIGEGSGQNFPYALAGSHPHVRAPWVHGALHALRGGVLDRLRSPAVVYGDGVLLVFDP